MFPSQHTDIIVTTEKSLGNTPYNERFKKFSLFSLSVRKVQIHLFWSINIHTDPFNRERHNKFQWLKVGNILTGNEMEFYNSKEHWNNLPSKVVMFVITLPS